MGYAYHVYFFGFYVRFSLSDVNYRTIQNFYTFLKKIRTLFRYFKFLSYIMLHSVSFSTIMFYCYTLYILQH